MEILGRQIKQAKDMDGRIIRKAEFVATGPNSGAFMIQFTDGTFAVIKDDHVEDGEVDALVLYYAEMISYPDFAQLDAAQVARAQQENEASQRDQYERLRKKFG